jgi:uncharacterized protein
MVDQAIVAVTKDYLRAVQRAGIPISFGVIFGSYAHGTPDRWSDIDLVVVSPQFDAAPDRRYIDFLWCQAAETDSRIEPIACGEKEWNENGWRPILDIARREGERIVLEGEPAPR